MFEAWIIPEVYQNSYIYPSDCEILEDILNTQNLTFFSDFGKRDEQKSGEKDCMKISNRGTQSGHISLKHMCCGVA